MNATSIYTASIYTANVGKNIDNGKGRWHSQEINIYMTGEKIGSYVRNYHNLFNTFCPFTLDGKDYALYSRDYTSTRIMTLPDCKDIGGEEPNTHGFCPTEYYCPSFHRHKFYVEKTKQETSVRYWSDESLEADMETIKADFPNPSIEYNLYDPFVFVAGCVWGDDWSSKLEIFDVSKAHEGIISRSAKFGYLSLPRNLTLDECIDMEDYCPEDDEPIIHISIAHTVNL